MAITAEQVVELKDDLNRRIVNVTFKKVSDGTLRTMRCTRKLSLVPEQHHPKLKRRASPDVAVVFDFDANDWRSFHYDTVRKFKADIAQPIAARKTAVTSKSKKK